MPEKSVMSRLHASAFYSEKNFGTGNESWKTSALGHIERSERNDGGKEMH